MRKNIMRLSVLFILALATVHCERASRESSKVSLQLPTYSNVSSLTCVKCLKRIIVNVSGSDFMTLKHNAFVPMDTVGAELSSEIILDVPSGPARKIQILAVYELAADRTKEIQYGEAVADIYGLIAAPITVGLTSFGPFKGGSIVGRYLTGTDRGPTDKVIISLNHSSGVTMDVLESEILNGWFEFFASENFQMSYRLADGTPLAGLQNKSLNDLTPAATVNNVARIYRPSSYNSNVNGTWQYMNEPHDIIYGYFGDAAYTANKYVCVDGTPDVTMSNLKLADNITPHRYNYSDSTAGIHGVGGVVSSTSLYCPPVSGGTSSFTNDRITIRHEQFDGMGNDTAKAMGSAFTYSYQYQSIPTPGYYMAKYTKTLGGGNSSYTFYGLPGLFATDGTAMFDGARLYEKAVPAGSSLGGFDHVICTDLWLSQNGFTETTLPGKPTVSTDTITFAVSPTSAHYILCPTKTGMLTTGFGGIFAGNLQ